MNGGLVDSNVILDVFEDDPVWANWSESTLERYGVKQTLYINSIIYTEVSIGFQLLAEVEDAINGCGFEMLDIPRTALFSAGKAFLAYRKRGGNKKSPLPDFFIGAHAEVCGLSLITRDVARYKTYFPDVTLVSPKI